MINVINALATAIAENVSEDDLQIIFSSGRKPLVGAAAQAHLRAAGVLIKPLTIPDCSIPIIDALREGAITDAEEKRAMETRLIEIFSPPREELLADITEAGRTPAVPDGGALTTIEGDSRDYPRVYGADTETDKSEDAREKMRLWGINKFSPLHINTDESGLIGIDEWKLILRGRPTEWFFRLPDGDVVKMRFSEVRKGDPGWSISFNGMQTPHGAFGVPGGGISISHSIGSASWYVRYNAEEIPANKQARLLDCLNKNPFVKFGDEPGLLESPEAYICTPVASSALENP